MQLKLFGISPSFNQFLVFARCKLFTTWCNTITSLKSNQIQMVPPRKVSVIVLWNYSKCFYWPRSFTTSCKKWVVLKQKFQGRKAGNCCWNVHKFAINWSQSLIPQNWQKKNNNGILNSIFLFGLAKEWFKDSAKWFSFLLREDLKNRKKCDIIVYKGRYVGDLTSNFIWG